MSFPRSQGSAAWTKDSDELGFDTSSSVNRILGAGPSSESGSPESRSPKTFTHSGGISYVETDELGSLTGQSASESSWMVPLILHENIDGKIYESTDVPALMSNPQKSEPLILSVEGSPAKTSPSPADAPGSKQENDPASSSSSPGSPMTLFQPEGMSSLRTYPDYFPARTEEISPSFSRRWPSSGFTTAPGESWTADTSECPNAAAGSSSLADVLEATVAPKYFLSPKAAAGILRRAQARGRILPGHLAAALESVAGRRTPNE